MILDSIWLTKNHWLGDLDRFPLILLRRGGQKKITGPSVLLHEIDFHTFRDIFCRIRVLKLKYSLGNTSICA